LLHKLINLRQGFGTREHDAIPLRAMAPVFLHEYHSRRDYYLDYLKSEAGIDCSDKTDAQALAILQQYRRSQYEQLIDEVYDEKGYDKDGIPLDKTLKRLGLHDDHMLQIVRDARLRLQKNASTDTSDCDNLLPATA
ncbi:MAG: hypothetical protein GY868_14475, partial [Deltaproteobacteria bacterium]|nr:hypothetical protein [Deltaproteobacteria bacterium]